MSLAENLNPVALIGAGGIGKTSIALTVLHHGRVKERFGDNRRFIRCDQFTASLANFINRLSKVVGAGVENPENLTPLRLFLSSREMLIVLDNAESILDPQGADGQKIYEVVEELSQFNNICLTITSRITTIPPDCKTLDIPTLSMDAARTTFYRIYDDREPPDLIDKILEQLDFHPLSVTLLATVAHQNKWDNSRLAKEWDKSRTGVLQPKHNKSLADTIELSLASPMFTSLGPEARDLLGVIAFFPQGINENNIDWLFSTISDRTAILDTFCILSLTYRSNGFITMLVPLRDYLRPKDPLSSPLFCTVTDFYLSRLSVEPDPDTTEFEETRWIVSEDVNVEHLLDVLTTIDTNSDRVWRACAGLFNHLSSHKPRRTILGPKIEQLPNDHRCKPNCLLELAWLFGSSGHYAEQKQLLEHALKLDRERERDHDIVAVLTALADVNRLLWLHEEGRRQAEEALEISKRIGDIGLQGESLVNLAWLLHQGGQNDAAEETASRAVELLPEKGEEFRICQSHRLLGNIYHSKGRREEAIHHFEKALGVATLFNWTSELYWIYHAQAIMFLNEGDFDNAHTHIAQAKSHVSNHTYSLGCVALLQARIWLKQGRREDARAEGLRALEIFQELGAAEDIEICEGLLRDIEGSLSASSASDSSSSKLPESIPSPAPADSLPACCSCGWADSP